VTSPRVGVIGARRARSGLGPFVVRERLGAGAEIPCFLSTSSRSRDETAHELKRTSGIRARGYLDLKAMLKDEQLDALAILSPHATHAEYLDAALEAGLHVLCEKPLVWGVEDPGAVAARLTAGFIDQALVLFENCQWPYTLPALERLHPGVLDHLPMRFQMALWPSRRGVDMLGDSLPHPLSVLQRIAPGENPIVEDVRFSTTDPDARVTVVRFCYGVGDHHVETEVEMRASTSHPRNVRIAINGRWATRLVSARDYAISFHSDSRSVPVDDPLPLLLGEFVKAISQSPPQPDLDQARRIVHRSKLLGEIVAHFERASE